MLQAGAEPARNIFPCAYRVNSDVQQIGVYSFQAPYVATVGADIIRPKRSGFRVFPMNVRAIHAVRLRADNIRPYGDSVVNTNFCSRAVRADFMEYS